MNATVIGPRNHAIGQPGRSAETDPTDQAVIIAEGLRRLDFTVHWNGPTHVFGGSVRFGDNELVLIAAQPRERNPELLQCLRRNQGTWIALVAGGAQLDLLPVLLRERLVDFVHLSFDKLHACTGNYDTEQALRKLAQLNPNAVIVATNPESAIAAAGGWIYRQAGFPVKSAVPSEGKGAAFFAAFLAIHLETGGDVQQALIAGHANGAAVAGAWEAKKALLTRRQLEEFLISDKQPAAPKALSASAPTPVFSSPVSAGGMTGHAKLPRLVAALALIAALLFGFTLLAGVNGILGFTGVSGIFA